MKIKFRNMGFLLAFVFLFFLIAGNASAYYVDQSIPSYKAVYWNYEDNGDQDDTWEWAWAGEFTFDFYSDDNKTDLLFSSYGFCVDLYGGAHDGFAELEDLDDWSWDPSMDSTIRGQLAWLLDNHWSPGNMSSYEAAGMQLAIWDVIYSGNGTTDQFRTYNYDWVKEQSDPSFQGSYYYYNKYFSGLQQNMGNTSSYSIVDFNIDDQAPGSHQEFITENPVPEPATFMLFGLGLLTIGAVGRKKYFSN